jgi:hypothetical protein
MNTTFTKREKEELEQCKKSLIISWKIRKDGSTPRIDGFLHSWCQRTNQPYVQIKLNRTDANVFMDLPGPGLLDKEGAQQFRTLFFDTGFPEQGITFEKPAVDGLPHEKVAEFAQKLVQIGRDFCLRHKPQ